MSGENPEWSLKRLCGTCAHWAPKSRGKVTGYCQRYAPRPTVLVFDPRERDFDSWPVTEVIWPEMLNGESCGEWREMPPNHDRLRELDGWRDDPHAPAKHRLP